MYVIYTPKGFVTYDEERHGKTYTRNINDAAIFRPEIVRTVRRALGNACVLKINALDDCITKGELCTLGEL